MKGSADQDSESLEMGATAPDRLRDIARKHTAPTEYIIFQNDALHVECTRIRAIAQKFRGARDALQSEVDGLESGRVCMRGMLHNEVEHGKTLASLASAYEDVMRSCRRRIGAAVARSAACTLAFVVLTASSGFWLPCELAAPATGAAALLLLAGLAASIAPVRQAISFDESPAVVSIRGKLLSDDRRCSRLHELIDNV